MPPSPSPQPHSFPPGFRWGVATSCYQIEGAARAGGRGSSVWDDLCRQPGRIADGSSGDVACDHYHRFEEDFDLMAALGIGHYRLSLAWPRFFPTNDPTPNRAGLDFYDRLVDAALARNVQPAVTCFHWDLPMWLHERGGWLERSTAEAFARYCAEAVRLLGDRVTTWYTINELTVVWVLGHQLGIHAPGWKLDEPELYRVLHHLLLGHGLAVRAMREAASRPLGIGMTDNPMTWEPVLGTPGSIAAAREVFARENAPVLGTLFHGRYPEGKSAPVQEGDMEVIREPIDLFGLNHYSPMGFVDEGGNLRPHDAAFPRTDFDWPVAPESIYWAIRFTNELYAPRVIEITENGCCYPDQIDGEGAVFDPARIQLLRGALENVARAIKEGMPVEAYYLWSFLDNFEWAEGYTKRFGIVHVNYETLARKPKASALWYRDVIGANALS